AAQTRRLGDGAVADVARRVGLAEAGQIQPDRDVGRTGEPAVARAAHPDAEVHAVEGHGSDNRAVGYAVRRVQGGFAGGHGEVQEEVVVGRDRVEGRSRKLSVVYGADQSGGYCLEEKRRGGDMPVVALV